MWQQRQLVFGYGCLSTHVHMLELVQTIDQTSGTAVLSPPQRQNHDCRCKLPSTPPQSLIQKPAHLLDFAAVDIQ